MDNGRCIVRYRSYLGIISWDDLVESNVQTHFAFDVKTLDLGMETLDVSTSNKTPYCRGSVTLGSASR